MSSSQGFIIAIDGPVASGKGTIAPRLASLLNGFYLYSGVVFRCIGLYCLEHAVDTRDEKTVSEVVQGLQLKVTQHEYFLNGRDVTQRIRKEDAAMAAANVAVFRSVREFMVQVMRGIAHEMVNQGKIVITEGRDTATVVFPDAAFKLFLTAKPEVRAKRRLAQIMATGEEHVSFQNVLADTITRDEQDTNRAISPLTKHPEKDGYVVIDSSDLNEESTVHAIIQELKKRNLA